MKPILSACERCGLRTVRYELELRGVIVRFCDECYWDEVKQPDGAAAAQERTAESAMSGRDKQ